MFRSNVNYYDYCAKHHSWNKNWSTYESPARKQKLQQYFLGPTLTFVVDAMTTYISHPKTSSMCPWLREA